MTLNLNYYSRFNRAKKKKNIQSLHDNYLQTVPVSLENTFDGMCNASDDDLYHNVCVNPFTLYRQEFIKIEDQAPQNNSEQPIVLQKEQTPIKKKSLSQINQLSQNNQDGKILQSSQIIDEPQQIGYQLYILNCSSRSEVDKIVNIRQTKRKASFNQEKGVFLDINYQQKIQDNKQADSIDDFSLDQIIDNHINALQVSTINIHFSAYKPINLTQSFTQQEQNEPIFKKKGQDKNFNSRLITSKIGESIKKSRVNFKDLIRTQNQMKNGAEASTVSGYEKKLDEQLSIKQKRRNLLIAFFKQN